MNTARLVLRDLVNATVGFDALAAETEKPAKSLHRMLSRNGTMDNLAAILSVVRKRLGVELQARAIEAARLSDPGGRRLGSAPARFAPTR